MIISRDMCSAQHGGLTIKTPTLNASKLCSASFLHGKNNRTIASSLAALDYCLKFMIVDMHYYIYRVSIKSIFKMDFLIEIYDTFIVLSNKVSMGASRRLH